MPRWDIQLQAMRLNAMRDSIFAVDSPSDENGDDRRASLDEAHFSHQLESMRGTRRFLSCSKYLLSSYFSSMVAANKKAFFSSAECILMLSSRSHSVE